MSMNPGATTWSPASSVRSPSSPEPIADTRPSVTATSARTPGAPVPSTTVPPRMTRSAAMSGLLSFGNREPVEPGGVAPDDVVTHVDGQVRGVLREDPLRVRERGVGVGVVARPQQPLVVEHVRDVERDPVVLEGEVHVLAEVLARHARHRRGRGEPVAVPDHGVVGPVHPVWGPARVGLDAYDPELGEPLEDAAEDERPDHVLAAADDAEEAVHLRAAVAHTAQPLVAGQDVEREREPELDGGAPERVPTRVVVVAVVVARRDARHHDAPQPELLDARHVVDALLDAAQGGLTDADEPVGCRALELGEPEVVRVEAGL